MSSITNKPLLEGTPQTALSMQLSRKNASAPAFRPQVMRSVRMHPVLAFGVAAVVLVGLVGYALTLKPVYLAIAQVYEEPATANLLSEPSSSIFDANKYETFLGEQIQLVQRLDVLTAALNTLPAATYADFGTTAAQAAENIQAQMKVVRVATSYQISISLKGTDPQKTADIVNAITTTYLGTVRKANAAESDERAQMLGEERQRIESELQTARTEQTALGASIGVANPTGESGNPYDMELTGIRAQLTEARAAHDVAAAQLASLSGVGPARGDGLTAAADELIAGDAGLGSMKATVSQRKAQLNEQMSGMTPTNPIYKQDQDQIADLDRTLDRMTNDLRDKAERRLQDKLRTDLQRTGDIESRLNGQLARQIANATSAAPRLQRASEVAADITRLDTRMAAVDDALRSLRLQVNGPAQVRLSLPATPPERPEANRKKQLLLLALPLAILFGIGAAVLARKQNKRIYGGVDIEEVLGFAPMAVLPARADVSARVFEEYVLRLAAGIESAYRTSGARTFLLTAVSLTTDIRPLASALTRKFEEIGVNVVVATASEMLNPTKGVPSVLAPRDPVTPGELERVVELWSKGFVAANVAKMKTEHGLVLIESEALLNCAQTEYVARCADATILMIECGVTTRQELLRAAELLHRLNVTGIGAVLEEVQLRYADADFRKAIESLERRQAESVREIRREPKTQAATAIVPEEPAVQPVVQPVVPAIVSPPEPEPVAEVQAAMPDVVPEVVPDVDLLETEGDRVQLEYEPAHYHEVLHHVRATRPTDVDEGWHLPVFAQVPAPAEITPAIAAETGVVSSAEVEVARPQRTIEPVHHQIVENASQTGLPEPEYIPLEDANAASNGILHEKIAPKLSARRDAPAYDGDASMTRKTSWLDKLLRRDSEAVVSIVPDVHAGDEAEESVDPPVRVVKTAARSSASSASMPQAVGARPVHSEEDYDIPLANRLEQISGARRTGVSNRTDSPVLRPSTRLQIVPPEPVFTEPEEVEAEEPAVAAQHAEIVAEPAVVFAPEVASPVGARGPRRPLTFHELSGAGLREDVAPVELASAEEPRVEAAAVEPAALEVLAHVSEFAAIEPEIAAHIEPVVEHDLHFASPAAQGELPEVVAEPVEEPSQEHVAAVAASWTPEPIAEPVPEPDFGFAESQQPRSTYEPRYPEFELHQPSPLEVDDIEPVYQEAASSLNSGRWDPIPPLRPSGIWRDRPSPVPVNSGSVAGNHYQNSAKQDAFNSNPPRRWVPEAFVDVEPEPVVPEPLLSRQWGLLSKFQQSRKVSSSSHPVAGSEGASDSSRDADEPGFTRGNRQS